MRKPRFSARQRLDYSSYKCKFADITMRVTGLAIAAILITATLGLAADLPETNQGRLDNIQQTLSSDVPRVLCLDESFATGGQPKDQAYTKAATAGFRSVLSLRTAAEGIDLARERRQVESNKMRYFNSPVNSLSPRPEQADEFLRITRETKLIIRCS
jgi:hypothetical protein